MAQGRKPKPHQLKVIAGTARPDREIQNAPAFDLVEDFPDPPQHLNRDGADMWNELGPQLVAAQVLQVVDLFALEQLCYGWQRFRQKARAGMPMTASEDTALKALFSEFGATPCSRGKVRQGDKDDRGNPYTKRPDKPKAVKGTKKVTRREK